MPTSTLEQKNALLKEQIKLYEILSDLTEQKKRACCLREMVDVQCSPGNWDYNAYMHGMANGMIYALSLIEGNDPVFLNAPTEWREDKN